MSLDEFQQVWKSEDLHPHMTFNVELLAREVERSSEAFRSLIFRRHLGQIEAVIWIILIWCLMGISMSSSWTWYLMIPVLLWMAIVYLVTLKQYTKRLVVSCQPVLVNVKASLSHVEHQIWLMRSLPWWNMLPAAVAMMAYNAHATWQLNLPWWVRVLVIGMVALLVYYVFRWMVRMNDLSVLRELEPRRSELRKVIENLESGNAEDEQKLEDLVSGLTSSDAPAGMHEATDKAIDTWNRLVPSWREVVFLVGLTLVSAYGAALFHAEYGMAAIIQSTRVASVTFAIALLILGIVANKRQNHQCSTLSENARYNIPAMVTIRLIMLMSILGSIAFLSKAPAPESRQIDKPNIVDDPDNVNR